MNKTKIDWCDSTLNAVVGCKRNCEYCYARKLNNRYGWIEKWTEPQFFPERLEKLKSKKSKSIFMNSMSDIEFWTDEQIVQVVKAINEHEQHRYIFLTKNKSLPYGLFFTHAFENKGNVFAGRTITKNAEISDTDFSNFDFWSIEPILEPITYLKPKFLTGAGKLKQIIIGAETGNRKGKVIPKKDWVDFIVKQADEAGIRIFMKESLKELMGKDFRQDELIWGDRL